MSPAYELIHRLLECLRADAVATGKVWLLIGMAVILQCRAVFLWAGDALSLAETFVLCVGLTLIEAASVRWVREFEGLQFLLLLALPAALWLGVGLIARVVSESSSRGARHADMERYCRAVRRDPRNVAAHVLLGDAYLRQGQAERARAEYRAACALEPHNWEIRYKLERAARLSRRASRKVMRHQCA
jgi:tetratricopeptide (TPR) repeat protein